jgi:RNA polymerase sigma-70 factor, ECF subfamily
MNSTAAPGNTGVSRSGAAGRSSLAARIMISMAPGTILQADLDSIYSELRRLAAFHLSRRAPQVSLQPTALVHETWLRLARRPWKSRSYFMAVASHAMRNVLVDYMRARMAEKRGQNWTRVGIDGGHEPEGMSFSLVQVLAVHEALERLSQLDERKARVVEMRFFGGMEFDEIAEALDISLITAKRDWQFARAWLYESLTA